MSRDEILGVVRENAEAIRGLGARRLGLFGSAVRGEDSESSDLDFVVEFEKETFDAYMDLKALLEDLFGRRVDLVISAAIKSRLRDAILGEAVYAEVS